MSTPQRVRCAIYTRKSSDEGLEQSFNSLDAQREACAAYILSQASEGWSEVAGSYDDGGLSGGTLERPALKRLLADVADGRIDIIVVYKVDRLTRSLLDFSKLVEAFDKSGTSFVSVTQSFNTTTSMGRLTLNMLLSFAQFEREVTAERIRDKIAASKAKGMWMGGIPPLGYRPDGRSLAVVEEHAAIVQDIYRRYLDLGTVRLLADSLARDGIHVPARTTSTGKAIGGGPFGRPQLYRILNDRTYLGEIAHKDIVYPGLHAGIVERDTFEAAQARLAENVQGKRTGRNIRNTSLLAGRIVDAEGKPLIASHATAGTVRYRYYTSKDLQQGRGDAGWRIPAREIETVVVDQLAGLLRDPLHLITTCSLQVPASDMAAYVAQTQALLTKVQQRDHATIRTLLQRVEVASTAITLTCEPAALATLLQVEQAPHSPSRASTLVLTARVRLTRSGLAMRLVEDSGASSAATPDQALVRLVVKAQRWWKQLKAGTMDVTMLAQAEGVTPAYVTRVLRLAFLAPPVTEAILAGKQRATVTVAALTAPEAIHPNWAQQKAMFLPDMHRTF